MAKKGKPYQQVVADVARALDPHPTVTEGEWKEGPDGRRDRDVVISGSAEGKDFTVLIECKDFDPQRTGPVGIGFVDALESKRRDLGVDAAAICSNAGFTGPAVRKASRVGIKLIGVMRQGDKRVRILLSESLYTRRLKIENLTFNLEYRGSNRTTKGLRFDDAVYQGEPVVDWVARRAWLLMCANPIVNGALTDTYRLISPIEVDVPAGSISVHGIGLKVGLSGSWYVQEVTFDASGAFYDWPRRRFWFGRGPYQYQVKGVNFCAGDPVDRPPDYVIRKDLRAGEAYPVFLTVTGLPDHGPGPDLNPLIESDDLDIDISDLPDEAYASSPGWVSPEIVPPTRSTTGREVAYGETDGNGDRSKLSLWEIPSDAGAVSHPRRDP